MGLMRALAAGGDRAGALQHARIYEALVDQELALPPDQEVVRLAEEIRNATSAPAPAPPPAAPRVAPPPPRTVVNSGGCIVAVVDIIDARGATACSARHLVDMLATNLARIARIPVLSPALQPTGGAAGAREAGATQLIDGTVYALASGLVRLDLRRVDLASGHIVDTHSASGPDMFALLDDGATVMAARLG
jgi:hypothetical protein